MKTDGTPRNFEDLNTGFGFRLGPHQAFSTHVHVRIRLDAHFCRSKNVLRGGQTRALNAVAGSKMSSLSGEDLLPSTAVRVYLEMKKKHRFAVHPIYAKQQVLFDRIYST